MLHNESARNLDAVKKAIDLLEKPFRGIEFKIERFPKKTISDGVLARLIGLRLTDLNSRDARAFDSFALRDFERRVLRDEANARGVPYEAYGLMKFYRDYIQGADSVRPTLHVIITERLIMSWSEDDLRYHARAVLLGIPCIISISGIVEAPARPRGYYLEKHIARAIGRMAPSYLSRYAGRYLQFDDERMPMVLKGYVMQCVFYAITGKAFCDDRDCVLFNAHWQEELINSMIVSGKLCDFHSGLIRRCSWQ